MYIPPTMSEALARQHQSELRAAAELYRRRRPARRRGNLPQPRRALPVVDPAGAGEKRLLGATPLAGPIDIRTRDALPAMLSRRSHRRAAMIDVRGLRKTYAGRPVVDGISFTVEEGEIFGILGPNGAGKTTTVECIGGLRRPDGGSITVAGLDPAREGIAFREALGIQLQESRLPDKQTVAEALQLYASFYDHPRDWRELAERLGLGTRLRTYFRALSGGQKQRLSVALALIGNPRVAILDELTTGLDPAARREVWSLLEDLRGTGVTLLLVSHFMEEAERLCDRVVVIDRGRIIAADTPEGLAASVAADQRVSFEPSAPIDPEILLALPSVHTVTSDAARIVVTGAGDVVGAVIVALHRLGVVATRLRVDQPSLDDAFVALTRNGAAGGHLVDHRGPGDRPLEGVLP